MLVIEKIRSYEKMISFIVGMLGLLLSAYAFVYEKKPQITFKVISEANVIDVHKPLADLEISFQGENVQKQSLNLRVLKLRIENTGQNDIQQGYYDQTDIWGFRVNKGKLIDVRFLDSNNSYLTEAKLNPKTISTNTLSLNKVILEKDKFFDLEVLVLHKKDIMPNIIPIGKIVGIEKMTVENLSENKPGFFTELFNGSILVHITRGIGYTIISILIIITVGFSISSVSDLFENRRQKQRRKKAEIIKRAKIFRHNQYEELLDFYVREGEKGLNELNDLLNNQSKLHDLMKSRYKRPVISNREDIYSNLEDIVFEEYHIRGVHPKVYTLLMWLEKNKFIVFEKDKNKVWINEEFSFVLERLLSLTTSNKKAA